METFESVFGLFVGSVITPLVLIVKFWISKKVTDGDVNNSLVSLIAIAFGMITAFLVNSLGHYNLSTISLIGYGFSLVGVSMGTNLVYKGVKNLVSK